ncbi:hypothetical protein HGQ85_03370 [Clostridioides difficile]|nr:hypothetical protein [Clostridioides difficile]
MEHLITKCYEFIKDCNLTYAFCGGYAIELFTNIKNRTHSDVDITLFSEDRKHIIDYILAKGWDVYEHLHVENCLRKITDSNDERALNCFYIWAIKPNCSFFKIEPIPYEDNLFSFEILNTEQTNFDFIDIIFNTRKNGKFICDKEKNISRELDKTILYRDNIPFLAPEVILFLIANPAYIESDYHREKNSLDFEFTSPLLSKESLEWLINSIEKAYPKGNKRLEQIMALQQIL